MFSPVKKQIQFGNHTLTLTTGEIARQADGAVMCQMGDTVVLVTAVIGKQPTSAGFLALSVDVLARTYAAGRIPGGYFRREGKPTERETLACRLTDRPLRPLFPEGFNYEVQVVSTIMSYDPDFDPDILSIIGASAALSIAGAPLNGVLAAARVGHIKGQLVLNPTAAEMKESRLDLLVAGTRDAILMVESEADQLSEAAMLEAVMMGHQQYQTVIAGIETFAAEARKVAGKVDRVWQTHHVPAEITTAVHKLAAEDIKGAYQIAEKQQRYETLNAIAERVGNELLANVPAEDESKAGDVANEIENLKYKIVREQILNEKRRIDGRDLVTVRKLDIRTGILPRTHGSAQFTRGETQALVIATLGTNRDAQSIEELGGEVKDRFMLHYNFPPYSVGEVGRVGPTKRREIGHGRLARRAVQAVLPTEEQFPYVLRVVSEITESNGSSSMATVCGTSLALMDAGVPIKAPVAGIAMGLIKEGDRYAVISDILGDEDHLGDMDFKVAGTQEGVTALQMDIKVPGITAEIMKTALEQAKAGRLHILGHMNGVLQSHKSEMSLYAPRIITIRVPVDKIREVIGKGGATIRALTEETGATIDISEDGLVSIASVDAKAGEAARRKIELLTAEVEVGQVYDGTVLRLMDFGAIVSLLPGKDGLVHISQIANKRVERLEDFVQEGQKVKVRVIEVDKQGRVRLSMKEFAEA